VDICRVKILNQVEEFAFIVALVIIGFFVVAFKDEKVRQEIFAGQAGIQFITLFSLVIAIILFGITGVLEGKELSALLGGLAGYILGRSATTTKS
jgi:presenilin-like A22 family membrane protease